MSRGPCVGIDLGGTKVLAAVVTRGGRIRGRAIAETPYASGAEALFRAIAEVVREALRTAGVKPGSIAAIGLGSPGPLDPARGVILRTPNIAVRKFPVGARLRREFRVPVVLDNDVHMALYGEHHAGAARGVRRAVGLWIGTGVGGAVLWDGEIVHGLNRNAGELGHMYLDSARARPGDPRGTLEWEASKTGMTRRLRAMERRGEKTMLHPWIARGAHIQSSHLAQAWRRGDRPARAVLERSARYVGMAIANIFDLLAPDLFVLGGGVVEDVGAPYVAMVRRFASGYAFTTELGGPRIAASELRGDAGALGAALSARHALPRR